MNSQTPEPSASDGQGGVANIAHSFSSVGWLGRRGTINLIAEALGLSGIVSLVLAWVLPWGYRLEGREVTGDSLIWLLILLNAGYLLAIALAGPACIAAGPWRKWVQRQDPARTALLVPSGMLVPALWGIGCVAWTLGTLQLQIVPRFGGFAVYFSGILLAVSSLLFWLAQADFAARVRWLTPTLALAGVIAVVVFQGVGWRDRDVVERTTTSTPVAEAAPMTIKGVAWERPLAEGETLIGDIGGRIILFTLQNGNSGQQNDSENCSGGVIALDPVTGNEAWRFVTGMVCPRGPFQLDLAGNDEVLRLTLGWPDAIYLDPATGDRLDTPSYPLDAATSRQNREASFLQHVAVQFDYDSTNPQYAGAMYVIEPRTGQLNLSRSAPRCGTGEQVSGGEVPFETLSDAAVLGEDSVAIGSSKEVLAVPIWCFTNSTMNTVQIGVWIVNLTDPSLDRVLWLDELEQPGNTLAGLNTSYERPIVVDDLVLVSFNNDSGKGEQSRIYAVDWRTGQTRWQRVDVPEQTPFNIGNGQIVMPLGLDPVPPGKGGYPDDSQAVPAVLDLASGYVVDRWEPGSGAFLDDLYDQRPTIAEGKIYRTRWDSAASGYRLEIFDLTTGVELSESDPVPACGDLYFPGATGLAGGTYFCAVDVEESTRRIVGLR